MIRALVICVILDADLAVQAADQWRFPVSMAEARRCWEIGCAHVAWLRATIPADADWIADADWRRRCWDLLDDCRRIHPDDAAACRCKLAELRRLIGVEWYWRGRMPEPLPWDRFRDR